MIIQAGIWLINLSAYRLGHQQKITQRNKLSNFNSFPKVKFRFTNIYKSRLEINDHDLFRQFY